MQRVTASQFSAVVLVVGTLMLSLADYFFHWRLSRFGLTAEGDTASVFRGALLCRLAYPFIHAHPLHAAVNGWVLLQLAFRTPLTLRRLLLAFVVAWSCPAFIAVWPTAGTDLFVGTPAMVDPSAMTALTAGPSTVVGLSGVLYALFGMWMPRVANRLRYNAIVALWLVAGLCTTSVAVGLHLYCYLLGILLSFLQTHRGIDA